MGKMFHRGPGSEVGVGSDREKLMNSMAHVRELRPIRLTCLETGSYTEAAFGFLDEARIAARPEAGPRFTEKGTGGHEGVRKEGQS